MIQPRKLTPALQAKAKMEFNETEERLRESIEALREWLLTQPHINARTDEQFLASFLRGCKLSLETAKWKIDKYYTAREQLPKYFKNRDIHSPRTQELLHKGYIFTLPKTDGIDGPRVLICRLGCFDPETCAPRDFVGPSSIIGDLFQLMDDHFFIAGYKIVIDAANANLSHFLQYEPLFIKQLLDVYQDGLPLRLKGAFLINLDTIREKFVTMIKSFLNEKNRSRIHILSNMDELYDHIPREIFPAEYGGESGTIQQIISSLIQHAIENEELVKAEEQFGVDESKRPAEAKKTDAVYGTQGSFRTLNLD